MTAQESKDFIVRYFTDLTSQPKTAEVIDRYVDDAKLKQHILELEAAFPNYQGELVNMIAEGDFVSLDARILGVHKGELNGVPATGRQVDVPFHITYKIQDGKIVDHWMVMDTVALLTQLGVMGSMGVEESK